MFALYQHKFDEKLKERCFNTYKFSNRDNNKFILLLWKGVYPYEYIDDWEKLNETSLPQKRRFLQSLKSGRYYWYRLRARKRVLKFFLKWRNLGEYHDLYVQFDTLLLWDVFENFQSMCLEIYEIDPAKFLSAPELA